jgi:hypothetical protein
VIGPHEIDKKVSHIISRNETAYVERLDPRVVSRLECAFWSCLRVVDNVVDIAVKISSTQFTWKVTVSLRTKDDTVSMLS